jgi:hypothetical protein
MFDSEGVHQAIYIVAEYKVIIIFLRKAPTADDFETKKFGQFSPEDNILTPVTLLCSWTAPDLEQDLSVRPV